MNVVLMMLASAASHSIAIDHHGTPITATYNAHAKVTAQTVGATGGKRMDMRRCRWTATVVIDRKTDHAPALSRTMASDIRASGNEPGACPTGNRLQQRIAARHRKVVERELMAAIGRDRDVLLAELDQVRALASN